MNEPFDPYYTWLGIPPHEQPANFYRLLGIQLFEPNQKVVDNAADRQMMLLRSFQNGPNFGESQRLLNEVSVARGSLLDPQKRAAYDHHLGQLIASSGAAPQTPLPPPLPLAKSSEPAVAARTPQPSPVVAQSWNSPATSRPSRHDSARPRRGEGNLLPRIVMAVIGGVVGLVLVILLTDYLVGNDMLGWSARSRKQPHQDSEDSLPPKPATPIPKAVRQKAADQDVSPHPLPAETSKVSPTPEVKSTEGKRERLPQNVPELVPPPITPDIEIKRPALAPDTPH